MAYGYVYGYDDYGYYDLTYVYDYVYESLLATSALSGGSVSGVAPVGTTRHVFPPGDYDCAM